MTSHCAALGQEFEELERKLPDDVSHGPEAIRLNDLSQLRASLDEVQSLLLAAPAARGGAMKILQLDLLAFGPFATHSVAAERRESRSARRLRFK